MKLVAIALPWLLGGLVGAAPSDDPRMKAAGSLAYVAGDYSGAVGRDGSVLDAEEYEEQLELTDNAVMMLIASGVDAESVAGQRALAFRQAVAAKRAPAEVERLAREVREALVSEHGLVFAPATMPDRARGRRLYLQSDCVSCHGDDGSAQTEAAAGFEPPPANFLSASRMEAVSPYRAFHAIGAGVPGTGMLAHPGLSEAVRWDLAFYVVGLRHQRFAAARGWRVLQDADETEFYEVTVLSSLSDLELGERLAGDIADPSDRVAALDWLRAGAPPELMGMSSDVVGRPSRLGFFGAVFGVFLGLGGLLGVSGLGWSRR